MIAGFAECPERSYVRSGEDARVNSHDLLIFDCDGVLIDSEVLSAEVLIALAAEQGIALTPGHVRDHFLGRSFPSVAANIRESFGVDLPASFESDYRMRLLARFETGLKVTDGVLAVLDRLTVRTCMATSSSPERARRSLAVVGLTDRFPRPFTASEVARGKPAPDLFLHAAATMGVEPGRCLVVEDSLPGLEAAQAAGMDAVHYVGGSHLAGASLGRPGVTVLHHWDDFDRIVPGLLRAAEMS